MTEHDSPRTSPDELGDRPPGTQAPAERDLTSLLDLHRRGVIDDVQFVALSRNLIGVAVTSAPVAAAAPDRPGRAWLSRRRTALVAGAASLVLAAGGISWAVLLDTGSGSGVEFAALETKGKDLREEPIPPTAQAEPSNESSTASAPDGAATASSSTAASSQDATPGTQELSATDKSTASTRSSTQAAPQTVPVPAPAPARTAPVPARVPAPAPVDCTAYRFAIEDNRNKYEAMLANNNIEWNMALNSGDLDRAAMLGNTAQSIQQQWSTADARLLHQYPGC